MGALCVGYVGANQTIRLISFQSSNLLACGAIGACIMNTEFQYSKDDYDRGKNVSSIWPGQDGWTEKVACAVGISSV